MPCSQASDSLDVPTPQKQYEDPWNYLQIDLEAVKSNYRYLASLLPDETTFYAVVKSDAYGHGIEKVGRVLAGAGCGHFAVETPQEAIRLRSVDIEGEILLMNPVPIWMAQLCVRHGLSVSVIHPSIVDPLNEAAQASDTPVRVHINVNVGLNRLGMAPSKIVTLARMIASKSHLHLRGLYGQPRDPASAPDSFAKLEAVADRLRKEGIAPECVHFSNSATLLAHPDLTADGVRLGILLYGVLPPEHADSVPRGALRPAMSLHTELVQLRDLPRGSRIGYRSKEKTDRDLVVGTIPIGFNHGLDRRMAGRTTTLVNGVEAPFIGAISMNSSTIDVTGVRGAKIGDRVTIVGQQGDAEITVNELAERSSTISAELMMNFGRGVAQVYDNGSGEETPSVIVERELDEDVILHFVQAERYLPENIGVTDVIDFLCDQLQPFHDPTDTITLAVDYALSSIPEGKGFILLATTGSEITGALVCVELMKIGVIPENLIVYVCVHRDHRLKGLGTRLIEEAIECCEGDLKLHVEKSNPAVALYRKLGFEDAYYEMRYLKKGQ
jgi:alanine racemase